MESTNGGRLCALHCQNTSATSAVTGYSSFRFCSRCLLSRRPLLKSCADSEERLLDLFLERSKTVGELLVEFEGKPFIVRGGTIRQVSKSELRHCSWQDFETVDVCESPHSHFGHTVRVFDKEHISSLSSSLANAKQREIELACFTRIMEREIECAGGLWGWS